MKWFLVLSFAIGLPCLVLSRPGDGVEIEKARLLQFPDESLRYQTNEQAKETQRILGEIHKINLQLGYVKKQDPQMKFLDSEAYLYPRPAYHPFQSPYQNNGQQGLPPSIRHMKPDKSNVSRKIVHQHSVFLPQRLPSMDLFHPSQFIEYPFEDTPRYFSNRNNLRKSKPDNPSKLMAVTSDVTSIVDYYDDSHGEERRYRPDDEEKYKTKLLDDVKSIIEEIEKIKSKGNPQKKPVTSESLAQMAKLGNIKYVVFPATIHKAPKDEINYNRYHQKPQRPFRNKYKPASSIIVNPLLNQDVAAHFFTAVPAESNEQFGPDQDHRHEILNETPLNEMRIEEADLTGTGDDFTATGEAGETTTTEPATQATEPGTVTPQSQTEALQTENTPTEQNSAANAALEAENSSTTAPEPPSFLYQFDIPLIPGPPQPNPQKKFTQTQFYQVPLQPPTVVTYSGAPQQQYHTLHSQTRFASPIVASQYDGNTYEEILPNEVNGLVLKTTALNNYRLEESAKSTQHLTKEAKPEKQRPNNKIKHPVEAEKGPFGLFARPLSSTLAAIKGTTTPKPHPPPVHPKVDSDENIESYEDTDDTASENEKHIFSSIKQGIVDVEKEALRDGGIIIKRLKVRKGGIAIAGPGGVATAGSGGTAIVGPGGLALTHPKSLTIAGPGAKIVALPESYDLKEAVLRGSSKMVPAEGRLVATGPTIYYNHGRK